MQQGDEGADLDEKRRRAGVGETEEEHIEEGRPLPRTPPGAIELEPPYSGTPGTGDADPAPPDPNEEQSPQSEPGPREGGGPQQDQTSREDEGLACPKQENDISRGENAAADLFEYVLSQLVNPDNPTPKRSALNVGVTSQAYFLPAPTATGRISYDDCKQTVVPPLTSIPGFRRGDLLEYKSFGFSFVLSSPWATGLENFDKQVENQNVAVETEGKGRQIYYCMGDPSTTLKARFRYHEYENSHFLVCHIGG